METRSLADRLFDFTSALAEDELIDYLWAQVGESEFGDWLWDSYDGSIELLGCKPDFRLTPAILEWLWANGFSRVWLQHEDNMETAYSAKGAIEGHRGPLSTFRVERAAIAANNRDKVAELKRELRQLKGSIPAAVSAAYEAAAKAAESHGDSETECGGGVDCWKNIATAIRALKGEGQ